MGSAASYTAAGLWPVSNLSIIATVNGNDVTANTTGEEQ